MTNDELRLHALNLAVASRENVHYKFDETKASSESFADGVVSDAEKYFTFLRGAE